MAEMASSSRKRKYNKITDQPRQILERFFQEEMTGAGVLHSEAIKKASEEAGLGVEQVKVSRKVRRGHNNDCIRHTTVNYIIIGDYIYFMSMIFISWSVITLEGKSTTRTGQPLFIVKIPFFI